MRVTSLGHAALYIETEDQRILVDPVFAESLAGGAVTYHPARRLDLSRMPAPTALVMTHGHFDHFHAPSLSQLSKDLRVIAPEDPELLSGLDALGFRNRTVCAPFQAVELGRTRVLPTPSAHEEPEFGVVISSGGVRFWHMADAEVSLEDAARVLREEGRIDVVSAKYQPVVRASMGHLRTRGAVFDKPEVLAWLESACHVDPAFVFPYASGLCFSGRHAWFNRYAFPLSAEEAASLLERRLGKGRAGAVLPGDVIEVAAGSPPRRHAQASPFVSAVPSPPLTWEPVDVSTLAGLDDAGERDELRTRLDAFLTTRLSPWLSRELARPAGPWQFHRAYQVVWQLTVELGNGERLQRFVDYRAPAAAFEEGRHPEANSFTHVSGRTLLDVLRGEADALLFWLTGEARSYEKIIATTGAAFFAPRPFLPQDEPGDPLTYFLRHFGPDSEGKETAVVAPEPVAAPDDLDVLARQGESRAVVEKKVLLSLLALREAERTGMTITDADVEATSNEFRARFGLLTPEDTHAWLSETGLDLNTYTRVMRGFTAVRLIQGRNAAAIAELVDGHARIASARRRDR